MLLLLLLPRRQLVAAVLGAPAPLPLRLVALLLPVDLERAQAAAAVLLGGKDAPGGAALGAVELAPELGRLARPLRVDGTALAGPVSEVLRVELELGQQRAQLVERFGCRGRRMGDVNYYYPVCAT